MSSPSQSPSLFKIAATWEMISEEERAPLRALIMKIVGYPCKLSCQPNNGSIDIYVYSTKRLCIVDRIEIQQNGALGVLFDLYPKGVSTDKVSDACEDHNAMLDVEFVSESEGEGEEEEEEEEEEGEEEEEDADAEEED